MSQSLPSNSLTSDHRPDEISLPAPNLVTSRLVTEVNQNTPSSGSNLSSIDTLVLSGGGIKGFNILGALQACIDNGLNKDNITTYVGTSVGSFICYLLAIGYSPIELVVALNTNKYLEKVQLVNLVGMINGEGATDFTFIQDALERLTLEKIGSFLTLGKLKEKYGKTLVCVTYNMTICHTEYMGPINYPDLPCLTALRMSANIPLVFNRFKYMDNYYIDGGIADNFPISHAIQLGKRILGIYLQISERNLQDEPKDGMLSYFIKLLYIPMTQLTKNQIKNIETSKGNEPPIIIPIDTEDIRVGVEFNAKSKVRLDMFSNGYSNAKKHLVSICN